MSRRFKILIFGLKIFLLFLGIFFEIAPKAEGEEVFFNREIGKIIILQSNTLFPISSFYFPQEEVLKIPAIVTAYSSTPWETDEDPHITASGIKVREGIVANNLLSFGTKIRIPEIFGEQIFVVEDRMNWKKGLFHFDVWFENYTEALNFGTKKTYVEVLE